MQNRTAIKVFTILLTLACLYQISFSFVTSGVEAEAEKFAQAKIDSLKDATAAAGLDYAVIGSDTVPFANERDHENLKTALEQKYLEKETDKSVYPLLGYSYGFCKKNELNLGLDLQGGMSVTLELSVPDLIDNLSNNSSNPAYKKAFNKALDKSIGNEDFLDAFLAAANDAEAPLGRIFAYGPAKDEFNKNMSNEQVVEVLKEKASQAVENTESIIKTRIDKFGVSQPNMTRQAATGRIMIELPGVKDKNRVRTQLQATANLEFWETYELGDLDLYIEEVNVSLSELLYPGFRDSVIAAQEEQAEEAAKEAEEAANAVPEYDYVWTPVYNADSTEIIDSTLDSQLVEEESLASEPDFDGTLDSTGARYADPATDENQLSSDDIKKIHPIRSRIRLNIVEQDGQQYWGSGAVLGVAKLSDTSAINELLANPITQSILPQDLKLMWASKPNMNEETGEKTDDIALYALKASRDQNGPVMTGDAVAEARQEFDQSTGRGVTVEVTMTKAGSAQWAEVTQKAAQEGKRPIAITMDDLVYSAPNVQSAITGGRTIIYGNFTIDEAKDLATLLNSGSLPAKLKIVEEAIVGPSLGAENVRSGLISFIIALLVVLAYMIFYYGRAGAVADVALFANIFFLVGTLASLQAALTLPGIAGVVLTIGMSVDANVLIFERIREEIRAGKGMKLAIADGYKKAYAAIVDANITTLLTAIVLSVFGSGPIQGFANTLIIGIFTSLFSAIFITRLIFTRMLERKSKISFDTGVTKNAFTKINIGWLRKRKMYYVFSGLIVAAGIFSLTTNSLDYGVEFSGGRTYKVTFTEQAPVQDLKKSLAESFDGNSPEVKIVGDSYTVKITTKFHAKDHSDKASVIVDEALRSGLAANGFSELAEEKGYEIVESRQVDAQISDELVVESLFAIIFSLIVIFLYILIRFRKWQFGLGALVAMAHDVMVVLGLFSLLYNVMPFSMEIDQAFIAAILTVVGYSINDTVVVFDRIREYLGLYKRKSSEEVVDGALNSTLSRTVNTSLSTFLVLLIIFIFGGEAIKGFVFALMIGVVVGTYSSLCIATPTAFDLSKRKLTYSDENSDKVID